MQPRKFILLKICLLLFVITFNGCIDGTRPPVRITSELDKRLYQLRQLPLNVGIYIDPSLRNHVQEEWLRHYIYGVNRFIFPIGKPLSSNIEEMSRCLFKKAIILNNLQDKELIGNEDLDGILTIGLKESVIVLTIEESVWRAIGQHKLSIIATFLDSKQNKTWESVVSVEGKGFDFVTSKVEHEWWVISGPNFAHAVNDAIQKVTYELAQKLIASKEISEYFYRQKS